MNNQNIKNQLEMFGLKVRDAEFFKQSEAYTPYLGTESSGSVILRLE